MELTPRRMRKRVGSRATFRCKYRANEKHNIQFVAFGSGESTRYSGLMHAGQYSGGYYRFGGMRYWTTALKRDHTMVACRIWTLNGILVGQLHSVLRVVPRGKRSLTPDGMGALTLQESALSSYR